MKVVTALTALAISTGAFAAADSSLNDLQYLPNAGTKYGVTEYSHTKVTGFKSNDVDQTLGYALKDNLSLELGLTYGHADGGSETDGLGDITLGARYRLAGFSNRFDIVGGVSVSPGDEEVDSDGDANNYSGGHALNVGVEYGNKTNERQWKVGAYYNHLLEATTDFDGDKEKADAHGELSFAAEILTRIGEKCFFKTSAAVEFEQKHDVEDVEVKGSTIWSLGGEYQHFINSDLFVSAGATALLPGKSENRGAMRYHVGASYQF